MALPLPPSDIPLPDGMPAWVMAFISQAIRENVTLTENGATQAVVARLALLLRLVESARVYLDTEVTVEEAAALLHRHPETIRRAVRSGAIPDERSTRRGHHRIRRRDLNRLAAPHSRSYDPQADAQDIARRRRPP